MYKEKNRVITPHVLSMRSYPHTQAKHAKKRPFTKTCYLGLMQSQINHTNQPIMPTISTSNTYPKTLKIISYYNPNIKE